MTAALIPTGQAPLWGDPEPMPAPAAVASFSTAVYEYAFTRRRIAEVPATITGPAALARYVATIADQAMAGMESEALMVVALDTKNHVIGAEVVYRGNVSASLVRVGELFRFAIRLNATGLILVHNHPSGDVTPSPDDVHLTQTAIKAGDLLDVTVLDHVIVGEAGTYTSLRDRMGAGFSR